MLRKMLCSRYTVDESRYSRQPLEIVSIRVTISNDDIRLFGEESMTPIRQSPAYALLVPSPTVPQPPGSVRRFTAFVSGRPNSHERLPGSQRLLRQVARAVPVFLRGGHD